MLICTIPVDIFNLTYGQMTSLHKVTISYNFTLLLSQTPEQTNRDGFSVFFQLLLDCFIMAIAKRKEMHNPCKSILKLQSKV